MEKALLQSTLDLLEDEIVRVENWEEDEEEDKEDTTPTEVCVLCVISKPAPQILGFTM